MMRYDAALRAGLARSGRDRCPYGGVGDSGPPAASGGRVRMEHRLKHGAPLTDVVQQGSVMDHFADHDGGGAERMS